MKLVAPQDRAALGAWIEGQIGKTRASEILAELPRLPTGEVYLWWPEGDLLERRRFPPISTFDSGATPAHGESTRLWSMALRWTWMPSGRCSPSRPGNLQSQRRYPIRPP